MKLSPSRTAALRETLTSLESAYMSQVRGLSWAEIRQRQDPPWAGISLGAGGVVYALLRSRGRRRASDLALGESLLAATIKASKRRDAFWEGQDPSRSVFNGSAGLALLDLEIARLKDEGDVEPRLRAFLARSRRATGRSSELFHGVAGYLTALVNLQRNVRDRRVSETADGLAHDLLKRAHGPQGWAHEGPLGFAHGRAGIFHALLSWSRGGSHELPATFFDDLARLAADVEAQGNMGAAPSSEMENSWCNGATGFALLWTRAYEHTGERRHLVRARRVGRFLVSPKKQGGPGNLCCGTAGRAYGLLAIDRVDPGAGWFDRALLMAGAACERMIEGPGPWPNGLHQGFPGLVCLAQEILAPPAKRQGFPLVDS